VSEEHPSFPGILAPSAKRPPYEPPPSREAELQIFLINPDGQHPPERYVSGQQKTAEHPEEDTAPIRRRPGSQYDW
jgi:hypothetical protein